MQRRQYVMQLVLTTILLIPLAFAALAQSTDELVELIQQSIEDIELEVRVAPTRAAETLEIERQRLDALRSQAPDHPMLSSLEQRIDELDEEIAAARADQPEAVEGEEQYVPLNVPAEVRLQLRDVEELQNRGDREMMIGQMDSAMAHLDQSEALIESIEKKYGDEIPPGYAALIVAKERLAALRDQLDRRQAEE